MAGLPSEAPSATRWFAKRLSMQAAMPAPAGRVFERPGAVVPKIPQVKFVTQMSLLPGAAEATMEWLPSTVKAQMLRPLLMVSGRLKAQ